MRIGIVDADLIGRSKHRFPNLACMKISGYHKSKGDEVTLITEYFKEDSSVFQKYYSKYDKIYVSKVFVDTSVPYSILSLSITVYGGSGFFYANALPLPSKIEHHMPDYHLYDEWIAEKRKEGKVTDREFIYYEEYSIGYTTRHCVRQCKFCINQHTTKVEKASPVSEFLDKTRPKICLLDDNILAYENWKEVFKQLNNTGKWFEFKQGFDIRALADEKAKIIVNSNIYINNIYFAFDNINDKDIIEEKLKLWKKHFQKNTHMYVLCGFDENNVYDDAFWDKDIEDTLERIKICIKYRIFPYIMRYRMYNSSPDPYRGMYVNLSAWCNQKPLFSKWSLNEWADNIQKANEKQLNKKRLYSSKRYLMEYAGKHPDIAYEYFDLKYNEHNEYVYKKYDRTVKNTKVKKVKHAVYDKEIDKDYKKTNQIQRKKSVVFAIKQLKNTIKIHKIDKSVSKCNTANLIQNKENITYKKPINILELFSTSVEKFNNGIMVFFHRKVLKSIPDKSISFTLINFKENNISKDDQLLLLFIQKYIKNDGNIFIFNTNLKAFTVVKEFIEKYTSLKFQEVTTFKVGHNLSTNQYCSRYVLKTNNVKNIFENDSFYTRSSIIDYTIKNTTKENDIAMNLFEQSNYMSKTNINRQWICLKKKRISDTEMAMNYIKESISKEQLSINEINQQDIG